MQAVTMRKLSWAILAAAVLGLLPAAVWSQQRGGALVRLDQDKLTQLLAELKMDQLLEGLAQGAGAGVDAKEALGKARKAQALKTKDQAKRDQLIDEAIRLYGELVAMTKDDTADAEVLRHLRFRLERIVLAGIVKAEPYVERLEYFLAHADDAAAVEEFTQRAVAELDSLTGRLDDLQEKWNVDQSKMITGALWKLEHLIREVGYRGAWVRYYRGMVLPAEAAGRRTLLRRIIDDDVKEFAEAEDNSSGVKYQSLRLSGAAARELGQFDRARELLRRADHAEANPALRMKAKFEYARTYLDQGDFDQAAKQIEQFRTEASRLAGIEAVGVDLQFTLLKVRLLRLRAAKAKASDVAQATQLENQAFDLLTELTSKYPTYRDPLINLLVSLMGDRDADDLRPAERLLLAQKEMGKKTPEALAKAEKILLSVVKDDKATPRQKGSALWNLGAIKNFQKDNFEAASYWQRLAKDYPKDPNAKNAALNAVVTYQAVLNASGQSAALLARPEFVKKYADALKLLVGAFGQAEAKYLYELGMMMDILKQHQEAIGYFARIPAASDLYMPSRYRILQQRVKDFQERNYDSPFERGQHARQLVFDLESYMGRVREFAAKPENRQRAAEVRGWGAQCGLLIATLYKDIGNLPEAIRFAQEVSTKWADAGDVQRDARTLVVQINLEQGKVEEILDDLTKLVEEDPSGAVKLLLMAVPDIGDRVERLAFATDPDSKRLLADLGPAYKRFADRLYKIATRPGSKLNEEQLLPFKRAWAHAHEAGSDQEVAKALEIYEQLHKLKPKQAPFVRGLARCYRRLGRHSDAMKHYDRLISGLGEKTGPWWRAQLERLRFYMQIMEDEPDKKGLMNVRTHIHRLGLKGSEMGGYYKLFNNIEAKAQAMLKSITTAAQPQPERAGG